MTSTSVHYLDKNKKIPCIYNYIDKKPLVLPDAWILQYIIESLSNTEVNWVREHQDLFSEKLLESFFSLKKINITNKYE